MQTLWVFGKQYRGTKSQDLNVVGEATWGGKELVYKFSKRPDWRVWWENNVSRILQSNLGSIQEHFAQVNFVVQIHLRTTQSGILEPYWPNVTSGEKWAMQDILGYEKIHGVSFMQILENPVGPQHSLQCLFTVLQVNLCLTSF